MATHWRSPQCSHWSPQAGLSQRSFPASLLRRQELHRWFSFRLCRRAQEMDVAATGLVRRVRLPHGLQSVGVARSLGWM